MDEKDYIAEIESMRDRERGDGNPKRYTQREEYSNLHLQSGNIEMLHHFLEVAYVWHIKIQHT